MNDLTEVGSLSSDPSVPISVITTKHLLFPSSLTCTSFGCSCLLPTSITTQNKQGADTGLPSFSWNNQIDLFLTLFDEHDLASAYFSEGIVGCVCLDLKNTSLPFTFWFKCRFFLKKKKLMPFHLSRFTIPIAIGKNSSCILRLSSFPSSLISWHYWFWKTFHKIFILSFCIFIQNLKGFIVL